MWDFGLGLLAGLLIGLLIEWLVDWRMWRAPRFAMRRQPPRPAPAPPPTTANDGQTTAGELE